MKEYPSISRDIRFGLPVYAFDKIDGSNIRAEWNKKLGFHKFGSRQRLLGTDQGILNESIGLIQNGFADALGKIFVKERYQEAICFFEFYGDNSFAGVHKEEEHRVKLIDVNPFKKGILFPNEYMKLFGDLDVAPLLYYGNCNHPFVDSVLDGSLTGIGSEGVVCKAPNGKTPMPIMFKIKRRSWLEKLRNYCGDDEKKFVALM